MLDFLMIATRTNKRGVIDIYPKFIVKKSSDLMIRGRDFYAVWIESQKRWSTDEQDAIQMIDNELDIFAEEFRKTNNMDNVRVLHLWDSENGTIDQWHRYCQKHMRDSYHMLDETIIFANSDTTKTDYSSKRLDYYLEESSHDAYDKLMSTLYSDEERKKIEWAIGSIVTGDSKEIQKFMVLYGSAGTGKSTILNIIQKLFQGYSSVFDAKALGQSSNSFALEPFKTNPLVAIQHDGDLSRIEDNTRLNSLVSHETMIVNEKFKSTYSSRFKAFLFIGTNKPVKITDAKSGLLRRLIDVTPSGNKLSQSEYRKLTKQINFELGGIAEHCKNVYLSDKHAYDNYVPLGMMGASNDFYNFVLDYFLIFEKDDGVALKDAYEKYKVYCEEANVPYPLSRMIFKEELKNYFENYDERITIEDGTRVRSYYSGFKTEKFIDEEPKKDETHTDGWLIFDGVVSNFDVSCANCPAQLAISEEDPRPKSKWANVKTTLNDISVDQTHYVKVEENHIVIDFDIKDENGEKSLEKNLEAANKWKPTYAELSKSGKGIHLHYIYKGDVTKLSSVYDENIEVKIFTGGSSLRRKETLFNSLPINELSSGLPLKGGKVVDVKAIKSEKSLRNLILRNMRKEIHPGTKPSVDFIKKILDDAYENGMPYDVTDMRNAIYAFAGGSTNHAEYCMNLVDQMKFCSEKEIDILDQKDSPLAFFDIEVFPNLLLVCWKYAGSDTVTKMYNPPAEDIEKLCTLKLVGFNCRRYDNHILYGRMTGLNLEQVYKKSSSIVSGEANSLYSNAYNLSYTDIYDFASAGNKKSLKKLEIEMKIHHKELGIPWDQPVPEDRWEEVASYCENDVRATEAAFLYLSEDWSAREILSDIADMTVNDTTNSLTTRIVFDKNRNPQNEFFHRDLGQPVYDIPTDVLEFLKEACPEMMSEPHGEKKSLLPYFEGYTHENGKSYYKDFSPDNPDPNRREVGEGGCVYAEPGTYYNVALLDIASMHPHSIIAECLFGPRYSRRFRELVNGRVYIKHEEWDKVKNVLDGKITPHIDKVLSGELTSKGLANALKTAINSVYGLTSARFDNPFKDRRNVDNIVAKRGALFMIDLKEEVQKRGFTVAHIKTDSIKIPNATPEIIDFVMSFGKRYGYSFEHEATYEKMCLVNDAVYIAKFASHETCNDLYGYIPDKNNKLAGQWTPTGKQFQVPYIFKTLFSGEEIDFEDLCETFSVSKGDLYLDMNESLIDVTTHEKELSKLEAKAKKNELTELELAKIDELTRLIAPGHEMNYVGRVGQFTPIKPGFGGGVLWRVQDGKRYAPPGSTGYRWLESEVVRAMSEEEQKRIIDISYYENLASDAIDNINKHGDYKQLVS